MSIRVRVSGHVEEPRYPELSDSEVMVRLKEMGYAVFRIPGKVFGKFSILLPSELDV
jgi:hypothetical protein